jgi:flavin-dependent dehydrogenase
MPINPAVADDNLPVLVVGGGIAGSAFALEMARAGRRVIVLERAHGPHHKVCGEFLSCEAQAALMSLGLDMKALGASPIANFRLVTGERHATTPLPFSAVGLSRLTLDEALLAAAERAGATIVRGTSVAGIEVGGRHVTLRSDKHVWRGAAAALATGKHSMRGYSRPLGDMIGFKMHLEPTQVGRDFAGTVQLVFFRGGYVGACLIDRGVLSIAWVMREALVRRVGAAWKQQAQYLARQSRHMDGLLDGARPLFAKPLAVAALPYGFLRSEPIASNIFPIGDQLAVVPSFTGDGMAIALHSGTLAARAFLRGDAAADYQRSIVAPLRRQFRIAAGIGRFLETPFTCAISIAAARLVPSLAAGLAASTRLPALPNAEGRTASPGTVH